MVTNTRNSCSGFNPAKCTHTHTVNTHPEQWAASHLAAPGEQLGVRCLAQGHLSRDIEGEESAVHSLPPPTIPAGHETQTRDLSIMSPTLYPLGHDSELICIFISINVLVHYTLYSYQCTKSHITCSKLMTFLWSSRKMLSTKLDRLRLAIRSGDWFGLLPCSFCQDIMFSYRFFLSGVHLGYLLLLPGQCTHVISELNQ